MKKYWRASIAALMLGTLTVVSACGGASQNADSNKGATPGAQKDVTIRLGTWDSGDGLKSHEAVLAAFEKQHPHIKVKIEAVPDNYGTKLLTQMATGSAPDVFQLGDGDLRMFVNKGVVEDLSGYKVDTSIYFPTVYDTGVIDGKLYFLPKDFSDAAVFYNKQMFAQAGVPLPKDGWTWDDFLAASQQLAKSGANKVWGVDLGDVGRALEAFVYQNGGNIISPDGKQYAGAMDSDATVQAVQFWVDMMRKGYAPTLAERDALKGVDLFQTGKAAMTVTGRWSVEKWKTTPGLEIGVAPLPKGKAGAANVIYYAGFGVYAKSRNKPEAAELLKFISGPEGAREYAKWGMPAVKAVAEELGLTKDPIDGVLYKELANVKPFASKLQAYHAQAGDKFWTPALKKLIADGGDVKKALSDAAQSSDKELTNVTSK